MKRKTALSFAGKLTTACLLVAAFGVLIQIISGHPYPKIPPVFFILLIPAALIYFAPWKWTPISAVLAGIFLTAGLFLSGASKRLIDLQNPGDSTGLWIQTLAVAGALLAGCMAIYQNYSNSKKTN
ncbi:hypothetical protein AHMF7605_03640 [Adhaeribacter arboris]|uniref:Uncharacterized protein n=1 Tax=Adhaeribacter arboris TaxID=2072846 RepID=A0A2T2YAX6_9BACT|nr:hypothetical protein [Adhaeribacter arboris]PSR52680.1 hypothetical protein AHMF7605_03640 [Adhaeribacter arboris]